ncbi:MAG: YidC/Oxa1 family insertase periplasmic-domain containing protein, partial [Flavobacteriales bacterium]|nr:YidC/Oxa1 family insertase periplasmic-domain containing protein [Flavobacteriales bacterium]
MDRNSLIGFVLIAAILGLYTWYTLPSPEEQARIQRTQDSLAAIAIEQQALEAERALAADTQARATRPAGEGTSTIAAADTVTDPASAMIADSLRRAALLQKFGPFAAAAEGPDEQVTIENERLQVSFSTKGAKPSVIRLKEYRTYHQTPLFLADPDSGQYEFRFFAGNADLSTAQLHFTPEMIGDDAVRFVASAGAPGRELAITYRLDTATYFMHVAAEFAGLEAEVHPRSLFFRWEISGLSKEKHQPAELQTSSVYYKYFNDKRDYLSESDEDDKKLQGRTNRVAF